MIRLFFAAGTLFAGLGVAAGALGAHGLSRLLTPERLETFETAVRYQMYHALGLLAVAIALGQFDRNVGLFTASGWSFIAGILLFSGSLFALSLSGIRWLGAITPLGGVAFVLGWGALLLGVLKK